MQSRKRCAGFTLIELIVVVVAVLIIVGILFPAFAISRQSSRQIKDSTQVRGIHQGMVLALPQNDDSYPLPSRLDKGDTTVAAQGREKDTTANIISILIYNGFVGPELCVSPA